MRQLKELFAVLEDSLGGLNFNLDFYHYSDDTSLSIKASSQIPQDDSNFQDAIRKFSGLELAANGKFFKGCV